MRLYINRLRQSLSSASFSLIRSSFRHIIHGHISCSLQSGRQLCLAFLPSSSSLKQSFILINRYVKGCHREERTPSNSDSYTYIQRTQGKRRTIRSSISIPLLHKCFGNKREGDQSSFSQRRMTCLSAGTGKFNRF